jgi:hypothetical protein
MEERTGGLCSVTAGHYSIMHQFRFFNVYEFQCSDSVLICGSSLVPRRSPLGTLTPETSASRATLHLPLATFS